MKSIILPNFSAVKLERRQRLRRCHSIHSYDQTKE